jgi:hypothetical protein
MKRLLLAVLFTATAFTSFAQAKPLEDSVMNLMNAEICEELGKMPASDFTAENFQMKVGMQMMGVFQNYDADLKKLYGEDYSLNQSTVMEIGKKIGMKLATSCKAFQELIMKNPGLVNAAMEKSSKEKMVKDPKKVVEVASRMEVISVFGKVISFTSGQISYYTIQSDKNKLLKVYWLSRFEGDDELISNPQRIIGKKVVFKVIEQKIYDAKSKMYKKLDAAFSYSDKVADEVIMMAPAN